jgi:predicted AAA+ superfamily ATPase
MTPAGYISRALDSEIELLFAEMPALMLAGPRAAGKTTTARRHANTVVRLDEASEARAFRDNPDSALRELREPVLFDEWQAVPGVLGAVKRAVDDDHRPGRFLLTGSVHAVFTGQTWPGTGRVIPLRMDGLTERELAGRPDAPSFLGRLADGRIEAFRIPSDPPDLRDYVALALRGGFPDAALRHSPAQARRWLRGYVDQLVTRDVQALDGPRDPARLKAYFDAVALNTAGIPQHKTLYDAAGINRKTAVAYDQLLANLFVLDFLPAWSTNRLARLARTPKRYLVDPSLMGAALGLDVDAVMRDGDLLGRLIDSFVMAQLRLETQLGANPPTLYHLRDRDGRREIDDGAELAAGDVVALEIKSTAAPTARDARHIEWLRDALGERFRGGAVLHTGRRPFRLTEHVLALPICSIWGG